MHDIFLHSYECEKLWIFKIYLKNFISGFLKDIEIISIHIKI
jgi:hypothetical protein